MIRLSILAVGSELLDGTVPESNSALVANTLSKSGYEIGKIVVVPDNFEAITGALRCLTAECDAVIVTGGLGPTADDRTRDAVSQWTGHKLVADPGVLQNIRDRFRRMNIPMPEENAKQALFPEGASVIPNPLGTAPGFVLRTESPARCTLAAFPGVPHELESMLPDLIRILTDLHPATRRIVRVTLRTIGLPESLTDETLRAIDNPRVSVGTVARYGQVDIRLDIEGSDPSQAHEIAHRELEAFPEIRDRIFSYSRDTGIEETLVSLLKEKKKKLILAESCTGGLIARRLTDVAGSSAVLLGSLVTYDNSLKEKILGVPSEAIRKHGAVSFETALEMAQGLRREFGADYCVAVTGIAGPDGGTPDKPVGTVFVSFAGPRDIQLLKFHFNGPRFLVREATAMKVFEILWLDLRYGTVDWNGIRMLQDRRTA